VTVNRQEQKNGNLLPPLSTPFRSTNDLLAEILSMARHTESTTRRPRAAHPEVAGDDEPTTAPPRRHTSETTGQHQLALAYHRLRDHLLHIARARLGKRSSPDDAEDVVQDAMTKFLAQRSRASAAISGKEQDARLALMVGDVALDRRRKQRRQHLREVERRLKSSGATRAARPWSGPVLRDDEAATLGRQVEIALEKIPPRYREAWLLVRNEQRSYAEASTMLNLPIETLRAYVCSTNRMLRAALGEAGITAQSLRRRMEA
jgi:DNA-directed RNA polymerase specialized sigma24 family protein